MALRDDALNYLRQVFGRERAERDKAESPSAEAEKHIPTSIFSVWGREDVGGLLSVSQNLMDRYADYEQMDDYPDINCFHRDTRFFDGHRLVALGDAVGQTVEVVCADGQSRPGTVERFGVQRFQRVVLKPVTKNGSTLVRRTFVVTPNHRWLLQDGSVTESLKVGDRLAPLPESGVADESDLGFLHGFVFGDGSQHTYYPEKFLLRLCGDKRRYLERLAPFAHLVGNPPSFGDDPILTVISEVDLKSLPDENKADKAYIASFIAGWIAADGCNIKNGSIGLYTQSQAAADWIEDRAAFYGYSYVGHSISTRPTNYGPRSAPLHSVILRPGVSTGWKVDAILDEGIEDEAFCVVEPETHSFVLEGGVLTGNCLTGDTLIYVVEGSVIKPFRLHDLAAHGGGSEILSYNTETQRLTKVIAENPRVTGNKVEVVEVGFSNGEKIKCTPDHKFLTVEHGYINCSDMVEGTAVVSPWAGFETNGMCTFLHSISGTLKVTQAAQPAGEEDVYDVSTLTKNFVANGVVVHNSTHHYFTNDATQPDIDTGKTVWVHSQDEAIKDMTDTLLNRRLRIEDDIWSMVYNTVKMGNNYEEVLVTENGVVGLNSLPCPTMRRVEQSNGALIGYVQDVTGKFTQDAADLRGMLAGQTKIPDHVALFEEWQVLHSRLRGTVRRTPYGYGVADGARWIWKRLVLLEDAMLIYKLTRAPARFAFYIDVTDIPSDKVDSFLRKAKQDLRKQKLVNPRTQRLDMRFNPMDNMEDFFIAVRENRELARVEVLQGPDYQATEDVEYFQRKLHGVLKVPRSYLGQDDALPPRSILSFEDVRAARVTMGIQREMKNTMRRLIMIDLASRGINPFTQDLQVMMTVPSGIYELAHNEIKNARADFATRVQPFVSMRYIQERVLKLSNDEIDQIEREREDDMKKEAEHQKMMGDAGGAPGGGGAGASPGGPMAGGEFNAGHPGNVEIGPPPGVAGRPNDKTEWKKFDAARRLEERRHVQSLQRDQEIQDTLRQVVSTQKDMAHRLEQSQQFFRELKHTYMSRNGNGQLIPQGRGRGHARNR